MNIIAIESFTDMLVWILAAFCVVLLLLLIINSIKLRWLKIRYLEFMKGNNGKSLEEIYQDRFEELDRQIAAETEGNDRLKKLDSFYNNTFQKIGLVKYDAFDEMGGKLSFSLALLNGNEDGFIINAMHSREGCYTYIKEVIDGNAYVLLSEEEREALDKALDYNS